MFFVAALNQILSFELQWRAHIESNFSPATRSDAMVATGAGQCSDGSINAKLAYIVGRSGWAYKGPYGPMTVYAELFIGGVKIREDAASDDFFWNGYPVSRTVEFIDGIAVKNGVQTLLERENASLRESQEHAKRSKEILRKYR